MRECCVRPATGQAVVTDGSGVYEVGSYSNLEGGPDAYAIKYALNGTILWGKLAASTNFSDDEASSTANDGGSIYVAGRTNGTLPGQASSGNFDAFVLKYLLNGTLIWETQFGSSGSDEASAIIATRNPITLTTDVYVGGTTNGTLPLQNSKGESDYFLRKYDGNGRTVWTVQDGTSSEDQLFGISMDRTGLYVVGGTTGTFPGQTKYSSFDSFIAKYDLNGGLLWTRQFGSLLPSWATSVSANSNGVYVGGTTLQILRSPNTLNHDSTSTVFPEAILPCVCFQSVSHGFIDKFDSDGNLVTATGFETNNTIVAGISTGLTGIYATGSTSSSLLNQTSQGGTDAFVRKYTFNLDPVWTNQFGTNATDTATGISVSSNGIYVSGTTLGNFPNQQASRGHNAFLARLSFPVGADFAIARPPTTTTPAIYIGTAEGGLPPYSFNWGFGDGTAGTGRSVSHFYSAKGAYNVTLTVEDVNQTMARANKIVYVTPTVLTADFTFSPSTPLASSPILFNATANGGSPPYLFGWDFGDGSRVAERQSLTHAYTTKGTFTVSLNVTDINGEIATVVHTVIVSSQPLDTDYSYSPALPTSGQFVTFTALPSGGTGPYAFEWTFEDGSRETGNFVDHSFASKGSFNVTLQVRDANNSTKSASKMIAVAPQTLSIAFTFSPSSPTVGESVGFTAAPNGGTAPYTFMWSFGDGFSGNGTSLSHTYTSKGRFTVTVTVTDSNGEYSIAQQAIALAPQPLGLGFINNPTDPIAGQPVVFAATTTGGTPPYSFNWNFGDSTTGVGSPSTHIYTVTTATRFHISLTVTDANGAIATATHDITVNPVVIIVTTTCGPATAGKPVICNASASGGSGTFTFSWSAPNGNPPTGTGASFTTTYAIKGSNTVTVAATDANGASGSTQAAVTVTAQLLTVDFTITPANPASGDTITFTAVASGGTGPYRFTWDFGDGSTWTGNPATHVFTTGGLHVVTLSSTDSNNAHLQLTKSVFVVSPPSAPQNLRATPGDAQIELSWESPTSDGGLPVSHYRVYRGNSHESIAFSRTIDNMFSYKDAGLTNGLAYYYQISAVNSLGEGSRSNEAFTALIAVAITSPTPPTTTAGVNVTIIGTSLHADYVDVQMGNSTWHTQWTRADGTKLWNATFQLAKINPSNGTYTITARASNATLRTSYNVTTTLTIGIYWAAPYRPPIPTTFCMRCVFGGGIVVGTTILAVQQVLKKSSEEKKRRKERQSTVPSGSITYWNRLEPRQRSADISDNLAAEIVSENLAAKICDPLRMMTVQWQLGRFKGVDGGSPAYVEIAGRTSRFAEWRPEGQSSQPLSQDLPLERQVTSEPLSPDYALRVELGQTFETLLRQEEPSGSTAQWRQDYLLTRPATQSQTTNGFGDGTDTALDSVMDPETERFLIVCADRCIDGYRVYIDAKQGKLGTIGERFVTFVESIYGPLPVGDVSKDPAAWKPGRMDYAVELAATGTDGSKEVLSAQPDEDADLEWYSFDLKVSSVPSPQSSQPSAMSRTGKTDTEVADPNKVKTSVMPIHVRFPGMPSFRWWDFEDARIDFEAMTPDKRDLARLIFMDFMLIYSNDWFVVPFDLQVGSLFTMESFVVRDIFGTTIKLKRADADPTPPGQRWSMFSTTNETDPTGIADCFLIPPTAAVAIHRGRALEEVSFLRDEAASMAWAIEKTIENGLGEPWSGHERNIAMMTNSPNSPSANGGQKLPHYHLQTPNFPRNWFPLLPVATGKGDIALVRGSMLSETFGEKPSRIQPAGRILKPSTLNGNPLTINEEEVPRSGIRVTRQLCYSRWIDGSGHLWIIRSKTPGTGEGRSGLQFDYIAYDSSS